jgi:hypothetical protein
MTPVEHDRPVPLRWGYYESRRTFALTMVTIGLVMWGGMPQALALIPWSGGPGGEFLILLPILLVAAGWVVLPTDPGPRRVAAALVLGIMILEYATSRGPSWGGLTGGFVRTLLSSLLPVAVLAAWIVVRRLSPRPLWLAGTLSAVLIITSEFGLPLLGARYSDYYGFSGVRKMWAKGDGSGGLYLELNYWGLLVTAAMLAIAWSAHRRAPRAGADGGAGPSGPAGLVANGATVQPTVDLIRGWQEAYRVTHDGAEAPPEFLAQMIASAPQAGASSRHGQTNVVAVLALIFGLVLGLVAIPLGHVALSQIRRTGESGRGMAIAGLILGYLSLVVVLAYVVVVIVALNSVGNYGY